MICFKTFQKKFYTVYRGFLIFKFSRNRRNIIRFLPLWNFLKCLVYYALDLCTEHLIYMLSLAALIYISCSVHNCEWRSIWKVLLKLEIKRNVFIAIFKGLLYICTLLNYMQYKSSEIRSVMYIWPSFAKKKRIMCDK